MSIKEDECSVKWMGLLIDWYRENWVQKYFIFLEIGGLSTFKSKSPVTSISEISVSTAKCREVSISEK